MDLTLLSAILVGAGCLALGYYIGARYPARIFISARLPKDIAVDGNGKKNDKPKEALEIEKLADILEDFKMVSLALFLTHTCTYMEREFRGEKGTKIYLLFSYFLQVLVVRNDLKMGKGKIAAQCR
jgi:PTH2 family peptidyl-tRNA hydrolase